MSVSNQKIVQRIKNARLKRKLTQQDLAIQLGKTAAAISDMERGKVQVSASELSIIADALNEPIEFFYGQDTDDQYIQDIITLIRKEEPEGREKSLAAIKLILSMMRLADRINLDLEREITPEELGAFLTDFLSYREQIKQASIQLDEIGNKLVQEINSKGLNVSGFPA